MADKIPEGWKKCKLGDAPFEIIDGDRGVNYPKQNEFKDDGYCLFLNAKNVTSNGFVFDECYFISKEKDQILRKGKLQRNDIILTTRGTVGNIGFFNNKIPYDNIRINSGMVIIRPNPDEILAEYTYQLFKNIKCEFNVFATGSAQPQLPIRDIKEISFSLPPLAEQRAIASVLSSLDDKIDLLQRQNKTLEAIAETLFRQWFVEEASEDWEECTLNDLCSQIASGGTPSTKIDSYYNGNINWYSTKELKDNFLYESENKITKEGLDNSSARLFPTGTVVIAIYAAPTVGRLGILANEASFNQAACGLVANEALCCSEFIYLYLKNQRDKLNLMASGSAQQNLNVGKIKSYPAFKVPKDLMNKFKDAVQPNLKKINNNTLQIRTLEKIRDTLLPKLISGEVRVTLTEEKA